MKAVIVCGGTPPSKELLFEEMKNCDYLLAADSGANCLLSYDVKPDYLIGDFDSVEKSTLNYFTNKGTPIEEYPREKDLTDSQIALQRCFDINAREIVFLGCTGTRVDHLFGNLGLLKQCCIKGIKATIRDDHNKIFMLNKSSSIYGEKGEVFSLQAFGENVENLFIEGGKYVLEDYTLSIGDSRTISNEFVNQEVVIKFKNGIILVCITRD